MERLSAKDVTEGNFLKKIFLFKQARKCFQVRRSSLAEVSRGIRASPLERPAVREIIRQRNALPEVIM